MVKCNLAKPVAQWGVDDVVAYLDGLQLGHLAGAAKDNALSGAGMLALSQEELQERLGLTKLQVGWVRLCVHAAGLLTDTAAASRYVGWGCHMLLSGALPPCAGSPAPGALGPARMMQAHACRA